MSVVWFKGRRTARAVGVLAFGLLSAGVAAAQTIGSMVSYEMDSGSLDNPTDQPAVVYSEFIDGGETSNWTRVIFGLTTTLPAGSFVVTTSHLDGESQWLSPETIDQWTFTSCYFNGRSVQVDLIAAPHSVGNRLVIESLHLGTPDVIIEQAICGAQDNRTVLNVPAVARLLTGTRGSPSTYGGGCSGFIINSPAGNDKCHLSAGHCFRAGTKAHQVSSVVQFDVPASLANCGLRHPGARDQFAVRTFVANNNGVGDDWAVFTCWPNPNTGLTTFQEQASARTRAAGPPANGAIIAVTGYGVDGTNVDNAAGANASCNCAAGAGTGTRNQICQTHVATVAAAPAARFITYTVDTCPANSGSPALDGNVFAIHTHGGCDGAPATNTGTRCDNMTAAPGLLAAIAACNPAPPAPCPGDLNNDRVVDISDLSIVLAHFGTAGISFGDANGDGQCNLQDLSIVLSRFGTACGP